MDPRVPVGFDEKARAAVRDDDLLEPRHELLARALRVAAVRVAGRLARVHQCHVGVGVVLGVQLVEDVGRVAVALVGEQAHDELGAHALPEVRVLGVPHGAQQLPPVVVALVNPDREADDNEVGLLGRRGRGCHSRG